VRSDPLCRGCATRPVRASTASVRRANDKLVLVLVERRIEKWLPLPNAERVSLDTLIQNTATPNGRLSPTPLRELHRTSACQDALGAEGALATLGAERSRAHDPGHRAEHRVLAARIVVAE
jgi:hypothetical protein